MNAPAPALPAGVDFSMQEALTAEQLQHLLRQEFNGPALANVNVVVSKPLMPWMVTLSGALNIYGDIHVWELELDIREIETADLFMLLVKQLNLSFDKAAESLSKG